MRSFYWIKTPVLLSSLIISGCGDEEAPQTAAISAHIEAIGATSTKSDECKKVATNIRFTILNGATRDEKSIQSFSFAQGSAQIKTKPASDVYVLAEALAGDTVICSGISEKLNVTTDTNNPAKANIYLAPMVKVSGGTFKMGCSSGDTKCELNGNYAEQPVNNVTVNGFYMQQYELTNIQYIRVMQWALDTNQATANATSIRNVGSGSQDLLIFAQSHVRLSDGKLTVSQGDEKRPIVGATWYGALAFSNYLSAIEKMTPAYNLGSWTWENTTGYRIPTEAEWEYAARGTTTTARYAELQNIAWCGEVAPNNILHAAGDDKTPNAYGLYNMIGNAYEGVWDHIVAYTQGDKDNPRGSPGFGFVIRGGDSSFLFAYNADRFCRASARNGAAPVPEISGDVIGFRIVRPL